MQKPPSVTSLKWLVPPPKNLSRAPALKRWPNTRPAENILEPWCQPCWVCASDLGFFSEICSKGDVWDVVGCCNWPPKRGCCFVHVLFCIYVRLMSSFSQCYFVIYNSIIVKSFVICHYFGSPRDLESSYGIPFSSPTATGNYLVC